MFRTMERYRNTLITIAAFAALFLLPLPLHAQEEAAPDPRAEESVEPKKAESEGEAENPPKKEQAAEEKKNEFTQAEIEAAINALNDKNFRVREQAQMTLWEAGRAAERAIEVAAEEGPLETRMRAHRILERFQFGIYPDTPEDMIELIRKFRRGTEDEQRGAMRSLSDLGEFKLLFKLLSTVKDGERRYRLSQAVVSGAARNARVHILADDLEKAEEALKLAAVSHEGMASYAAFLHHTGKLEAKLAELSKADAFAMDRETLAMNREIRHWLERTTGRMSDALATAERLKNAELIKETKIAMGDLLVYTKNAADLRLRTVKSIGFKAAQARLEGDEIQIERTTRQLIDYAKDHPNEIYAAYVALMVNGKIEEGIQLIGQEYRNRLFDHRTQQRRFADAFATLGIENVRPPYTKWIDAFVNEFPNIADLAEARERLYGFNQIVSFLVKYGEKDTALKLCQKAAPVIAASKHEFQDTLINALRFWEFRDLAYKYTQQALETGLDIDTVTGIYLANREEDRNQWTGLLADDLKADPIATLRALDELIYPKDPGTLTPAAKALLERGEAAARKADEKPKPDPADEDPDEEFGSPNWHKTLGAVYEGHEMWDDAKRHWELSGNLETQWQTLVRLGNICLIQKNAAEASEWYRKAWEIDNAQEINLYTYGWALMKNGENEKGKKIMQKALLLMLGDSQKIGELARRLIRNGDAERGLPLSRYVVNTAPSYGFEAALACESLGEYLIYTENAAEAAMFLERRLLDLLNRGGGLGNILQYQTWIASAKARDGFSRGDADGAMALARLAMSIVPGDSSILEELYPLMANGGAKEKADILFEEVYAKSREEVTMFPNYGQGNNNHAWLLSRCRRNLDEALVHAKKAVKIRPDSAASIDTLAEVHYARGEFEQAVETSNNAIELAPTDVQLRRQNERFLSGLKKN